MRTLEQRFQIIAESDKKIKFFNQAEGLFEVWVDGKRLGRGDIQECARHACEEIEAVRGFFKENYYLSNYGPGGFEIDNIWYDSNEQWYMSNKTLNLRERGEIMMCVSPNDCKQRAKTVELRPDWETYKFEVMLRGLRAKFTQNPGLREKLLSTRDGYLEESNTWNDRVWGVSGGIGKNYLGVLLMQVRREIQNELDIAGGYR